MKPIWFLDIDGVINICRPFHPHDVPIENWRFKKINYFPIRWDTRVIDFINAVHRDGDVEVCWLTTWGELANKVFGPDVGLDQFTEPDEWLLELESRVAWWKFDQVLQHDVGDRPVIWTDDDFLSAYKNEARIRQWVADRQERHVPTHCVTPRTSRGLSMADLDEIRNKIQKWSDDDEAA